MPIIAKTVLLLVLSNVFMTYAWYGHLKDLKHRPVMVAVMVSWSIAFFEYLIQVPANRIGFERLTLAQLKILQEVITVSVFMPFAIYYKRQSLNWNYFWAALCLCGAVFFVFRPALR